VINKVALNILKNDQSKNISIRRKRNISDNCSGCSTKLSSFLIALSFLQAKRKKKVSQKKLLGYY